MATRRANEMAAKTNTDKIDELTKTVYTLASTVDAMSTETVQLPSLSVKVAILENQVADLKKNDETLITRLWMIGVPLIVAVIGTLLTALLRK
jgi:hypothetical protein